MAVIRAEAPGWRALRMHESSPIPRGASATLMRECPGYVASQFFRACHSLGSPDMGVTCEDLEQRTFADETFDLIVKQDVLEHDFRPVSHQEIWRTLRPGGPHAHTMSIYKTIIKSDCRAERLTGVAIRHWYPRSIMAIR